LNPNTGAATIPHGSLRERLEWLMLFRVVVASLLLGSAVIANLDDPAGFSDPTYIAVAAIIIVTYLGTIGLALWLRRAAQPDLLVPVQILGDAFLATSLVLMTGGIESIFTFLFFFTIFTGAILRGRQGALFTATIAALSYLVIFVIQFSSFGSVPALFFAEATASQQLPFDNVVVHVAAFYAVGFGAGYLAERIGQVGSELERRQLDIRQLRALNDNIVRSLSAGLVTLDLDGRVSFFNPAAAQLTGISEESARFQPLAAILPELANLLAEATRDATLPDGRVEGILTRPNGDDLVVGLSVALLRDPRGLPNGYVLTFQDLTALKSMEVEVQRRDHLAAIGKLSAAIAHEIRNPLASISGCVELLAKRAPEGAEERQLTDIVVREVDRLNGLVEEFLEYARPIQVSRRRFSLTELVGEVVQMATIDVRISDGILIEMMHHASGELILDSDPQRIRQVLLNLVRNGCQAMERGGRLRITTSRMAFGAGGSPYVAVQVDDTGPGLTEEVRQNLFEPFFTTKQSGTGLGLATSYRIVIELGGLLLADNAPGGGARFVLMMPLLSSADLAAEVAPTTSERVRGAVRAAAISTASHPVHASALPTRS
jgi:two-component system sensor histidine kinase PilS (NtrC family)